MGNLGVGKNALPKEKLKADMADYLNGLNSVGEISYTVYSEMFDLMMEKMESMYELGREEALGGK